MSNSGTYHHYVPQFYLKGFLDPVEEARRQNVLWLYEAGQEPKRRSVRSIAGETDFYTLAFQDKPPLWIEQGLSEMESHAAPTLVGLRSGNIRLSAQARGEFAGFIALSFCRVPFAFDMVNKLSVEMNLKFISHLAQAPGAMEKYIREYEESTGENLGTEPDKLRDFMGRVLTGEIKMEQLERGWTIKVTFETMLAYLDIFERIKWTLIEAPSGAYFVTSDVPVAISDPGKALPSGDEPFRHSRYLQFTFPISRSPASSVRSVTARTFALEQIPKPSIP